MSMLLENILASKRLEIKQLHEQYSFSDFEKSAFFSQATRSLKALLRQEGFGLIAEFKRKSPSAGQILSAEDPVDIALEYQKMGAAAISVLTDAPFFGGNAGDLSAIKLATKVPVLRKDFIISEIQLFQAKAIGADLVLLIAEALTAKELLRLCLLSKELGLEVLVELHEKSELEKLNDFIDFVGVNNRNLKTQRTDVQTCLDLFEFLPEAPLKIAESGIKTNEMLKKIEEIGYHGALVGESLLKGELVPDLANCKRP